MSVNERLDFIKGQIPLIDEIILGQYSPTNMRVDYKGDGSPVTEADRNTENHLRDQIRKLFPDDTVIGEEFGITEGKNGIKWYLDPIDGTQSFICGVPLFGSMIGVEIDGDMCIGMVHFPALEETIYSIKGEGAWWKPTGEKSFVPARCSQTNSLDKAVMCITASNLFEQTNLVELKRALKERVGVLRGWGDCYGHMLVATGRADLMVDPLMNPWDNAALMPIITEAGGVFSNFDGKNRVDGGNGLSTNKNLSVEVRQIVKQFIS